MHESEKSKWRRSVVSDPQRPRGLQPFRLLHPWDFLGKSTGVGAIAFSEIYTRIRKWNQKNDQYQKINMYLQIALIKQDEKYNESRLF